MSKKKFFAYFALAGSVVLLAVALTHLADIGDAISWIFSVLSPIIVGLCLAFVLNVIMSVIEKRLLFKLDTSKKKALRKLKRPLAIILTLIIAIGFVTGIVAIVYPTLRESVELIIKELPGFMTTFSQSITDLLVKHNIKFDFIEEGSINWTLITDKIVSWIKNNTNNIVNITTGVAGNVFGVIFDFILSFILAIYVLAGKEKIRDFCHNLMKAVLSSNVVLKIERIAGMTYDSFARFITGQLTEAIILGVLCAIGMIILRIPMAPVVSVIIGVTALIPIFGAWIGGGLGMFFILIVDPVKSIVFIIYLLILQQIETNIIYPKVVGESIGLPGLLVLVAVTIGGEVAGIAGLLFSVPITSVIYTLLTEFIKKKRTERNLEVLAMISDGGHETEVAEMVNIENPSIIFDDDPNDNTAPADKDKNKDK